MVYTVSAALTVMAQSSADASLCELTCCYMRSMYGRPCGTHPLHNLACLCAPVLAHVPHLLAGEICRLVRLFGGLLTHLVSLQRGRAVAVRGGALAGSISSSEGSSISAEGPGSSVLPAPASVQEGTSVQFMLQA